LRGDYEKKNVRYLHQIISAERFQYHQIKRSPVENQHFMCNAEIGLKIYSRLPRLLFQKLKCTATVTDR